MQDENIKEIETITQDILLEQTRIANQAAALKSIFDEAGVDRL